MMLVEGLTAKTDALNMMFNPMMAPEPPFADSAEVNDAIFGGLSFCKIYGRHDQEFLIMAAAYPFLVSMKHRGLVIDFPLVRKIEHALYTLPVGVVLWGDRLSKTYSIFHEAQTMIRRINVEVFKEKANKVTLKDIVNKEDPFMEAGSIYWNRRYLHEGGGSGWEHRPDILVHLMDHDELTPFIIMSPMNGWPNPLMEMRPIRVIEGMRRIYKILRMKPRTDQQVSEAARTFIDIYVNDPDWMYRDDFLLDHVRTQSIVDSIG